MKIKRPKTKYNDKKVVPKIRHYILEYIHNLDKVFADLEKAGVIIAGRKSQFYQTGIKIMRYICNANDHHPDISKGLKNFV